MTKKYKRERGWNSWGGGGWLYLGGGLSCSPCCQAYIESGLGLPCSLPARCRVRFGTHDVGAPSALAGVAGAVAEVRDRRRDLLPVFAVLVGHGAGLCVGWLLLCRSGSKKKPSQGQSDDMGERGGQEEQKLSRSSWLECLHHLEAKRSHCEWWGHKWRRKRSPQANIDSSVSTASEQKEETPLYGGTR